MDRRRRKNKKCAIKVMLLMAMFSYAKADHGPGGDHHHHNHNGEEDPELSTHHQRTLQKIARQARQNLLDSSSTTIDFSKAYDDPDTGLKCVDKEAVVQTKEREKLLQCTHSMINVCHYTYVTKFTSQRQDECKDNYEKQCQITFKKQATNETVKKCYKPMVQMCDGEPAGSRQFDPSDPDVICKTVFESECTTRYREKQPGKFVGDTECTKLPIELCGTNACKAEEGEEECHNKTLENAIDVPEEICDLVPQKTCRGVYKLVPYLVPEPECKDVPREVCSFGVKGTKLGEKPIVTKWCYDGEAEPQILPDSVGRAPPEQVRSVSSGRKPSPPPQRTKTTRPSRTRPTRPPQATNPTRPPRTNPTRPSRRRPTKPTKPSQGNQGNQANKSKPTRAPTSRTNPTQPSSRRRSTTTQAPRTRQPRPTRPQTTRRRPTSPQPTPTSRPSSKDLIATLGPDPAPIAGDISYEYEDYDYDYDTIQNIQTFVNRPTTPTTPSLGRRPTVPFDPRPVTTPSPGFRPSVVGTASADISFDLDYNNNFPEDIRSGKRINSASKEEFDRLQELIEDYESQQVQSSSSEEGDDLGEYYYYDYYEDGDEDGGTAAEQDTEDPLLAQPTTTSQFVVTASPRSFTAKFGDYDLAGTESLLEQSFPTTKSFTTTEARRTRKTTLRDGSLAHNVVTRSTTTDPIRDVTLDNNLISGDNDYDEEYYYYDDDDEYYEYDDDYYEDDDIVFHDNVPEAVKGVIQDGQQDSVKVARVRPNSGEVQESAEREALAKVIKHKGKDRQLDKTVIIKNTPEAFRVFGIKNVPKSLLDRMKNKKQLESFSRENQSAERQPKSSRDDGRRKKTKDQNVSAGTRRPSVFRGEEDSRRGQQDSRQQSQSNRQSQIRGQQQEQSRTRGGNNQDPSSGEARGQTLFRDEVRGVKGVVKTKAESGENWTSPRPGSSSQVGHNEIGDARQQPGRDGKSQSQGDFTGVTRGRSPTPPPSVQILDTIKIEETVGNRPVIQPQLIAVNNPNNPFLTTTRPVTGVAQVVAKGSPSWETNTARPFGIGFQPVETPVNSRPIITSDGNGNFNPPATFGQFVEVKTNNQQNPTVAKVQGFAVPSNPPGPNKFQQAQDLHQSSLENTIRTHGTIIGDSSSSGRQPKTQSGFVGSNAINTNGNSFEGRDPFAFPNSIADIITGEDSNFVRTTRNQNQNQGSYTPSFNQNQNQGSYTPSFPVSSAPSGSYNGGGGGSAVPDKGQFKPPTTLMYGFKPLTTPGFGPTRSPQVYASQGKFQAPGKLMFGFSPLSNAGGGNTPSYTQSSRPPPPPSVPFYAGAPRPGPAQGSYATNQIIVQQPSYDTKKKRQIKNNRNKNGKSHNRNKNNNNGGGSGEKSSRSLFDIFSGMLEPITTPLKNFFSGLRED